MTNFTAKEKAEKKRIDRKVYSGKASRKEVLRGLALLRKQRVASKAEART